MAYIQERHSKNGKIKFRVLVRLKGYPTQCATFDRKTDAKIWIQQTEAAIREGRHFKTTEAKKHTMGEAIDRYIRDVLPYKPKSEKKQKPQLSWWKAEIGSFLLADVTSALIAECRDKLARGETYRGTKRQPATINRYLAAVSHVFTIAMKEWGWIENSPVRNVTRPTEARGRVRFLSDDERGQLLQACKESRAELLYPVVVLALSTGMRRGEIMNLTWDVVEFKRKRIILEDTKNQDRRGVPLAGHAMEVIEELSGVRRIDTKLVFPSKDGRQPVDLRSAFENAVKIAGIENFRFHDLRHTAASYLAMNGASIAEIAEVLGHRTLEMVKRYAHLSESHTAGVVARMNEKMFK